MPQQIISHYATRYCFLIKIMRKPLIFNLKKSKKSPKDLSNESLKKLLKVFLEKKTPITPEGISKGIYEKASRRKFPEGKLQIITEGIHGKFSVGILKRKHQKNPWKRYWRDFQEESNEISGGISEISERGVLAEFLEKTLDDFMKRTWEEFPNESMWKFP